MNRLTFLKSILFPFFFKVDKITPSISEQLEKLGFEQIEIKDSPDRKIFKIVLTKDTAPYAYKLYLYVINDNITDSMFELYINGSCKQGIGLLNIQSIKDVENFLKLFFNRA